MMSAGAARGLAQGVDARVFAGERDLLALWRITVA